MIAKWTGTVILVLLAAVLLTQGNAHAGADDLGRQADTLVRDAERKMFSGNNEEAAALLDKAALLIDQGKSGDPGNATLLRAEKNLERVKKAVDKKRGAMNKAPASASPAPGKATTATLSEKLPGGVKKRLQDISKLLDETQKSLSSHSKNTEYRLQQAKELFDEIHRGYSGQFDPGHPDVVAVQTRLDDMVRLMAQQGAAEENAKAEAAEGKAAGEEQSREWVERFRGFLSYPGQMGHNPDTLVTVPAASEPQTFDQARKRYEAFKAFYGQYRGTQFPNGRTWELEDLADNQAPMRLKEFEEGLISRQDSLLGDTKASIDQAMRQLEKDNGWQSDTSVKPNLVDLKWMASIEEAFQKTITALEASDPRRQELQTRFDTLVAKDRANRQIRKERTFMGPDRYAGSDMDELKKKAESIVRQDTRDGGEPMRCTITSGDWQEQTLQEWTDTTKTAWRTRTTRSLTAQVAARTSEGIRLITVALARDKLSDGTWGALYGNLHQYSEPMLESNVNR